MVVGLEVGDTVVGIPVAGFLVGIDVVGANALQEPPEQALLLPHFVPSGNQLILTPDAEVKLDVHCPLYVQA